MTTAVLGISIAYVVMGLLLLGMGLSSRMTPPPRKARHLPI